MDMNKLYKKAYIVLFNSITDALAAPEMAEHILKNAQQLAEEIILTGADCPPAPARTLPNTMGTGGNRLRRKGKQP